MAQAYPLPKWGLTMEEGTIVEWSIQPGEPVREGQVLGLIGTDKIEVEFESPADGVVAKHLAAEGEEVPVGQEVVVIAEDDQDYQAYLAAG